MEEEHPRFAGQAHRGHAKQWQSMMQSEVKWHHARLEVRCLTTRTTAGHEQVSHAPRVCSLPQSLHFSQPTQSMTRLQAATRLY